MNDINLTDICQAYMLMQYDSNTKSDTGVEIDSEPHLSHTCKTGLLFAPLAVRVHAGCSACPFYTQNR